MSTEISIEFFPPTTTEGADKLHATCAKLAALKPAFFSVTYGAGGSTRERTFSTVKEIAAAGFAAAPHLSCVGSSRASIREILHDTSVTDLAPRAEALLTAADRAQHIEQVAHFMSEARRRGEGR